MSRLAAEIYASPEHRERYKRQRLAMVSISEEVTASRNMPPRQLKYRIEAKLGAQVFVDQKDHEAALKMAIERTKRALIEHVFGEFRKPLYMAVQEARGGDPDKAAEYIEEVLASMFDCAWRPPA